MHADTAAAPRGATTAMLVVGLYSQILGGDGVGVAVRVEHQETARTAVGLELGGGRGEASLGSSASVDRGPVRHWLIAARTYGRFTPREHDFVALTYGGGLSVMDTGLVALTLHGGGAISYPNRYLVPVAAAGLAASIPLRAGGPLGGEDPAPAAPPLGMAGLRPHAHGPSGPPAPASNKIPKADLFPYVDAGLVIPIGDTGNRLSLDLGLAAALQSDTVLISLSAADAHRFDAQ